jgi:hypothetical protein
MAKARDTTMALFAAALAVFLATPYLPTALVDLVVGYRLSALIVIAATAYVFKRNMLQGLALFLAFAALFLEYRRRKVDAVRISYGGSGGPATLAEARRPAAPLVKGEVHPRFQIPLTEEHDYEPGNGDNSAPGPGEGYDSAVEDQKEVIETVSPHSGEVAPFYVGRGLAA